MIRRLGLLSLIAAAPLAAQERSLSIERFVATIVVEPDGGLDVTETITARFVGSWNGLFRTIPVKYRTPQGFNWTLGLELLSATDGAGEPLRVESSRERHYLKYKIWVPNARDATRTIALHYRATNGLRFFENHDELYWNVTGDEWDVPLGDVAAEIRLPPGATGVRAMAFNGPYGSTARDAEVSTDGTTIRLAMPQGLGFREGLTAVVGWDKGVVAEPTAAGRAMGFLSSNWPLAIPIPIFFAMLAIWRRKGKDPDDHPVVVQYEPPAELTPAEAGTLIDNSADMRDVTATVVDLAVRGLLRIEERDESKLFGLVKKTDYLFHRVAPVSDWHALKPHERRVLEGIFDGAAESVALSDLENEFYKSLPGIKSDVFDGLIGKGYYRSRPDTVQGAWIGGGIMLAMAVGIGGSVLAPRLLLTPVPFIIAGVAIAAIMVGFGVVMPARTVNGARARERVTGFLEFLDRVEGDRLRDFVKTPEMFERFLPYAMAFGVEKKWARAFAEICTEPPRWYSGGYPGPFNATVFSDRLSTMSSRAASTMASSPRSSSGSGFSGGSSGGGGGGGGGGGF